MMGRTHLMIGALAGAMLQSHAPLLGIAQGILIGAVGGLVPDFDHPNSKATRQVAPIKLWGSRKYTLAVIALGAMFLAYRGYLPYSGVMACACWLLVAALSKHRGITHSLLGLVFATYAVQAWLGTHWLLVFAAGYVSHLIADMLTERGVPLLWPMPLDFGLPTGLSTGSAAGQIVEKGIQIGCVLYMGWIVVQAV